MEKISSSGGGSKFVCKKCNKEFDSFVSWRAHLGFHGRIERQKAKREQLDAPLPSLPPPAPAPPAQVGPQLAQAFAGLQPPPAQGGFDVGQVFMAWVMRQLMEGGGGGGKLEREIMSEALETYRELLKLPRALVSSMTGGLGGGLKEAMKGVAKEALREELKSLEDLVRKYAAGGGEKEAGSQASGVEHSEETH